MMSTKEEGLLPDRDLPLPSLEELIPLGISLISPELARAFSICQDISPNKAAGDESQRALGINGVASNVSVSGSNALDLDVRKSPWKQQEAEMADMEESDSAMGGENSGEEPTARTLKRPRLVWTPQLHKRFVDAVAHLGIKNAVPKTIMQLMNVEGLTRENVASHLQKYRLYLKRMQGLSSEGPSSSDHLFASTPVPPGLAGAAHFLPGHRDDVVTALSFSSPLVPMSMPGLGGGHIGSLGGQRPYGLEHHPFAALGKMPSQRIVYGDPRDMVVENQSQSISSPRCALTLFPTSNS